MRNVTVREFESQYGGGPQTAAQRLAELACERKYKNVVLPPRFWNLDKYKRDYQLQLRFAHGLLKLYSPAIILAAFADAKTCYSLGSSFFEPYLRKAAMKVKEPVKDERPRDTIDIPKEELVKTRPVFSSGKSQLDKLKDL